MRKFSFVLIFLLVSSCGYFKKLKEDNEIKHYLTVHRFQDGEGLGKFSFKLKLNKKDSIDIARFAAISNKSIIVAIPFQWEKGFGLELILEDTALNNWFQEMGRDLYSSVILLIDGEYYSNAYYDRQSFKNPVRLYCSLPKEQAEKLAKQINKNYQIILKEKK